MSTLNAIGSRQSRLARRNALVLALLATLSLSACGGDDADGDEAAGAPETGTSAPSSGSSPASGDQNGHHPERHPDPDHLRQYQS